MGVGYAAFQSQLKISGTSNIASNFLVKITSITPNSIIGTAADKTEITTYNDTSATFGVSLKSPGDSITYDITIENKGTIDAVLKTITKTDTNNTAILFETSGVNENDELKVGEIATMKVKVTYNPEITSQPTDLDSNLTVELDYEQSAGGNIEPVPGVDQTIGGQEVEIVESGDGLYEDSYESGRLIYRGQNPNNYIEFNDELWRIIAKEADGTYKIIRNEILPNRSFDEANHRSTENNTYCQDPSYGCGVYAKVEGEFSTPSGSQKGTVTEDSSIKIYLNNDYYVNNIDETSKGQITNHLFNIGSVEYLDQSGAETDSISKNIVGEKMYQWTGNVGLVNVSDVLKSSTNPLCTSASKQRMELQNHNSICTSNYLLDFDIKTLYWTINAFSSESANLFHDAWYAGLDDYWYGIGDRYASGSDYIGVRPVVFLKSNITLEGLGTSDSPFTIVQ